MSRVRATPLASWFVAALAITGALSGFACSIPDTSCIGRGAKTSYAGTLTVQAALDGGAPAGPQGDGEVVFTDYDPNCVYDQEEFLIEVAECQLWVKLDPTPTNTDSNSDTTDPMPGSVEGSQACTLHTSLGEAVVSIASGRLTWNGSSPAFSLDAAIGSLDGKPASGTVHVDFVAR
jgi:hypothetical protein